MTERPSELTMRERVAVILLLLALRIVSPWRYEHQRPEELEQLREAIKR